ncbi:MAG TPA: hypothetical protein DD662_00755 [Planctomycetaceae bacterium]|nr:hypothetical protein [Planctomycetaceae bacterium]
MLGSRIATASSMHAMSMNTKELGTESRGIRLVATVLDSEVAMTPSTSFMRSLHSWSPVLLVACASAAIV